MVTTVTANLLHGVAMNRSKQLGAAGAWLVLTLAAVAMLFFGATRVASAQNTVVVCEQENKAAWDAYKEAERLGTLRGDLEKRAGEARKSLKFIHDQYLIEFEQEVRGREELTTEELREKWRKERWSYLDKNLEDADRRKWRQLREEYLRLKAELQECDKNHTEARRGYEQAWSDLQACLEKHPEAKAGTTPPAPKVTSLQPPKTPTKPVIKVTREISASAFEKKMTWEEAEKQVVAAKVAAGTSEIEAKMDAKLSKVIWKEMAREGLYMPGTIYADLEAELGTPDRVRLWARDHQYYTTHGREHPNAVTSHAERQHFLFPRHIDEKHPDSR